MPEQFSGKRMLESAQYQPSFLRGVSAVSSFPQFETTFGLHLYNLPLPSATIQHTIYKRQGSVAAIEIGGDFEGHLGLLATHSLDGIALLAKRTIQSYGLFLTPDNLFLLDKTKPGTNLIDAAHVLDQRRKVGSQLTDLQKIVQSKDAKNPLIAKVELDPDVLNNPFFFKDVAQVLFARIQDGDEKEALAQIGKWINLTYIM